MPLPDRYSVHIHDRSQVEYRDVDRTVILPAGVFNPSGLGGVTSTVHFDPLVGCDLPSRAYARAEDMLGHVGRGDSEREYWVAQARRVLSGLLHLSRRAATGGS